MTFTVVYLTERWAVLVAAGLRAHRREVGGIVGRIAWGGISDWRVAPRPLLGLIGLASGVCAFATAAFDTGWPLAAILATSALFGATAIGWNGVQLAEVARNAPADRVGAIMGASGFIGFAGVMIGPLSSR